MPSRPTLVGRDAELAVLERALEALGDGRAAGVALLGEPGIGKSRLLRELAARARSRGHLVLEGRVAELERDVLYGLWVDALDDHFDASLPEEERVALAVALPAARRALGRDASATVERHRVARAIRALLARLATPRPVVLALDDVHWADPASADVLALLLQRPPKVPILLALALRPGRAPAVEAALGRGDAVAVELGPLSREAAEALLPSTLTRAARARVYRESGGNPLYLEALAGARGTAAAPVPADGVPRAVMAALVGELLALPEPAQVVARGAAVAGDPFDPAIAAAAAGVPEAEALAALDVLAEADLVRPAGARRFAFRHPLVRRAVYESAGGGWRLAAHARAAEAQPSTIERAHHVERAARPGDLAAADLLVDAAQQTASRAPATAADWYGAALRLLPDQHPRRAGLLREQARALWSAGRVVEAREVLRQAVELLPVAATGERVELVVMLAELEAIWTQQPEQAWRRLEREREALGDLAPGPAAALTLGLAAARAEGGDHRAGEALAEQARELARAAGDRVLEAAAAAAAAESALVALREDDPVALAAVDARIAEADRLVTALADDELGGRLDMLLSLAVQRLVAGDATAALAAADRGLRLARAGGQGVLGSAFWCARGLVEQELGRLDAAEADVDEALESSLLSGITEVAYWAHVQWSWLALARGNVEEALEHGQRAWDLLGTRPASQAGFTVADARLAAGDPAGAVAALEAFGWVRGELWPLDRLKAADVAVRVLVAAGRPDEAAAWAPRIAAEAGGRRTGLAGAIAARARATALLAAGEPAAAEQAALAGVTGPPLWAARCRTAAGEALAAAGRAQAARRELRAAAAALDTCGAWRDRDAALLALRRLGDRPRPARPAPAGGDELGALTRREREVALLVGEGLTNAQVALRLQLSEKTVEKHVSRVLAKLGLASRAGIVRLLAQV